MVVVWCGWCSGVVGVVVCVWCGVVFCRVQCGLLFHAELSVFWSGVKS